MSDEAGRDTMFGSRKSRNPDEQDPKGAGGATGGAEPARGEGGEGAANDAGDADFAAAGQIEDLMAQVEELRRDRDHFQEKYIRTLADYQNSQRRAAQNEREAKTQGVRGVVLNILTVLDHFDLALGVDTGKASAQQVVDGVKLIRDELMRVLTGQGVVAVNPAQGDEFDPMRHQAVSQDASADVEPGRVVRTLQPGYMLDDRLIRPAMVSVRAG